MVMFSFSGWNAAVYLVEEIREPRINIPRSLVLGTLTVTLVYLLINLAYFSSVPVSELSGKIAVAEITARATFGTAGTLLTNILILFSILSSMTAMSIAGPRVYFAMARNRLFPKWLTKVHQEKKIPLTPLLSGILVTFFGGLTLYFNNPIFYYIKPTVINLLFAVTLLFGKYVLKKI